MSNLGKTIPMPLGRRVIGDFLRASINLPTITVAKEMNVAEVMASRNNAWPRPSWCSIFTKAYAKVVATHPELRRACLTFPWERMFESADITADLVVETRFHDETVLAHARVKHPESRPLLAMDKQLSECKENPGNDRKRFLRPRLLARFPRFIRDWAWWYILNGSGAMRYHYFGTFGVSSMGQWGVKSIRPLSPWISLLHYGPIQPNGSLDVLLTYDHRVLDGSGPSRALAEMGQYLQSDLLSELQSLQGEKPDGLLQAG